MLTRGDAMSEQSGEHDFEDQDAEPGSKPTGAAAQDSDADDQDAGPASEPQDV
jgi:hypothetical protein